jgi:Bacterial Ig domain/Calx-beta domain/Lamin Tail Domain/RTX calcium-binding nonapeptide repeat (4 copies)
MRQRLERWLRAGGRARTAVLFVCLCATLIAGSYLARAHPVTVDGVSGDWLNRAPIDDNTGLVVRAGLDEGEYVWRDAAGDERTSFASPDPRVDIREVRYTGTPTHLNALVEVASLPVTSGPDTAQVQLAIDTDLVPGSGQNDFVAGDTLVANAARWERLVKTRFGSGNTTLAVYTAGSGTPAFAGAADNAADGTIELSVPWSALGSAGPPASPLRVTLAVFRSMLDDDPRDVGDATVPDALDVVTDYGDPGTAPNTSSELAGDQVVDYFADLHFTAAGEVEAPIVVARFAPNYAIAAVEWVEVANATTTTLNLSSVKLGDEARPTANSEGMHAFPLGTTLDAGNRAIVARSGAAYTALFGQPPDFELQDTSAVPNMEQFGLWSTGSPDFADPGEELLVLDRSNTIVDVVTYGVPPTTFPGLVAKTPAPAAGEVQRRATSLRDTDDNQADFDVTACVGLKRFDGGPAGTGTQWDLAANWNNDTLPGAGDHVCIPALAIPGVIFDSGTHAVLSVTSEEPFTVSGGSLSLTSGSQPSSFAALTVSGGTIGGAGNVDVTGVTAFTGGTMTGAGTTTANGGLTIAGTTKTISGGRTLVNDGAGTWSAGQINMSTPSAFRNAVGRTLDIQFDGTLAWATGGTVPTFENDGTLRKSGGAGTASIQVALPNDGLIDVDSGRLDLFQHSAATASGGTFDVASGAALELRNGTFNLGATSAVNGAGLVEVSGATVNVNGGYAHDGMLLVSGGAMNLTPAPTLATLRVAAGTLNLATAASDAAVSALQLVGGTLTGPGDVTVGGATTWSGGTMSGSGTTFTNGPLTLDGTTKTLTRTLENNGGATWSAGQINLNTPSTFHNPAGRTFDVQFDGTMAWSTGGVVPTFANDGTFTKSGGAGTASIQVAFPNSGSVSIATGRLDVFQHNATTTSTGTFSVPAGSALELRNGAFNLDPASTIAGGGLVDVTGGTVNVAGSYTPTTTVLSSGTLNFNSAASVTNVSHSGGTLGGSADLTVANLTWTGGTQTAPSVATSTTVTDSLELTGGTKTLTRRTFENDVQAFTPTTWSVGNLSLSTGAVFNHRGRINVTGDQDITGDAGTVFNVLPGGVLAKDGGGENTHFTTAVNNDGTVLVPNGHIRFLESGSHSGPFTIGASGVAEFEGGTQTIGGPVTGVAALLTPAGLTATPSDTGGSLATGTYFYRVAARNLNGETLASAETSAAVTGPAGRVTLAWDAVPGATSYRVYRGTASSAQNVFYTAGSAGFVDTGAAATGGVPQTLNTSGARAIFSGGAMTVNGTYEVLTTHIANGTHRFEGATTLETLHVTAGTGSFNAPTSPARVNHSGGTLAGSANMSVGHYTWTGGTLTAPSVAATTTVTDALVLGGGTKTLTRRTFENNVPVTTPTIWPGGNLDLNTGSIFNHRGRITVTGDQDLTGDSGTTFNVIAGAVFAKDGGGENTHVTTAFNNDGTVLALNGHLRLLQNGSHSGPFTIGTGGVIEYEGGTQTSGGAITGAGPLPTPTGLTATGSNTGGSLATGTYFYKVAARNINGETLASTEASASVTGPSGRVNLAWDSVPGATSYRVYRGTASNAQTVFFTSGTNSFGDTGAGATAGSPQAVNNSHARAYFSGGTIGVNGSYDVPTTWVGGGAASFNGPTSFGELHVFGGVGAMNRPNIDVAFLSLTAGAIGGTGQLTVAGPRPSSWTGGAMHTAGTTRVAPGVTLNLTGGNVKDVHTNRLLRNEGTIVFGGTANIRMGGNGLIENPGLFDVQTDSDIGNDFGGTSQIVNTGTFRKSVGAGVTDLGVPFDNDGTVQVETGTLRFNSGDGPNSSTGTFVVPAALDFSGGTYDLAATSTINGTGTVLFTNGPVNLSGTYDVATTTIAGGTAAFEAPSSNTDVLNLVSGSLTGGGRLTLEGPAASTWSGGTMTSVGTTFVPAGVTLSVPSANVKDIHNGRVLRNEGTILWPGTGNLRAGSGALIENVGLFELQTDADLTNDFGGTNQIVNTGMFRKTTGSGTANPTSIGVQFDNDGSVVVEAGSLRLDGADGPNVSSGTFTVPGTLDFSANPYDLGPTSAVNATGTVLFTGGHTNVTGAYDVATTTMTGGTVAFESLGPVTDVLSFSGGNIAGGGRLTIEGPGASSWTGGTMLSGGTTRVGAAATLTMSGANVKDMHGGRVLRNAGMIVLAGTGNFRGGNATTENVGLFDIQTDADINQDFGGVHLLRNTGVLRKSGGTASTDITVTVDNTGGQVEALAATLNFNNVFANYNEATDVLTGGSYLVRSSLRFNGADVVTNNAKVVLDTAASRIQDNATTPADGLRNFAVNGPQGDFSITGGRDLFASAARGPNLTNNGILRGTGTYFQNVTNNGTVAPGASPGILTVDGTYAQSAAGGLEIEVGGTGVPGSDFDRLVVTGTATLAGTLTGRLFGGFEPVTGGGIDVLTAASRTGTFGVVSSVPSPLPGNLLPEARYDTSSVELFAVPGGGAADDSVGEGAGLKTVTVTLSAPSSEEIAVDYETANGTALAGSDYEATSGTLTFPAGHTSKSFDVAIVDDTRDETDQTFLVDLSSPSNTLITDPQATITLVDDDELPTVAIADLVKAEGSAEPATTPFDVQVSLSAESEKSVTVGFATADDTAIVPADYVSASGTVTFAPGETAKPVTIQVEGDRRIELDENLFVDTASPVNATLAKARGVVTILDDDSGAAASQLSVADAAPVVETDGDGAVASFTVTLSPSATGPVSVAYEAIDGSAVGDVDFARVPAGAPPLQFAAGETSQTIEVPIDGDNLDELDETFRVVLSGATGAVLGDPVGMGTIVDDDATPLATAQAVSTNEDTARALTLGGTDGDLDTLSFEVLTTPLHGTLGTLVGNQVTYTPAPDYHGADSFTFRAHDGANQSAPAVVAITVDPVADPPVAGDDDGETTEDAPVLIEVLRNDTDADGGPLTVAVDTDPQHGSATVLGDGRIRYVPTPNFAGEDSFTYTVGDGFLTDTATVNVAVAPVNDLPVAGDDAAAMAFGAATDIAVLGNDTDVETAELAITALTDPAKGTAVAAAGGIRYTPDAGTTGLDTFEYTVADGDGGSDTALVRVVVAPPGGGGGPQFVAEEGGPASEGEDVSFTIGLTAPSLTPVEVLVETVNGTAEIGKDYLAFRGSFTFGGANPSAATILVKSLEDALDETDETIRLTVVDSDVPVVGPEAVGTIADDDALPALSVGNATVTEGNTGTATLTFEATLAAASGRSVSVDYATANGSATAGEDYTATSGTLTFPAGQQTRTVSVTVHGDTSVEGDEALALNLANPLNATIAAASGTGTIGNDDSAAPPPPPPVTPPPPPVTPPPPPPVVPPPPPVTPPPPPVTRNPAGPTRQAGLACTLTGTAGRDVILGTKGRDVICGLGGADTLVGLGGNDVLVGGLGNDTLLGGAGKDRLLGGLGRDRLLGGLGKDRLFGGAGVDMLDGGAANDRIDGGQGKDVLIGRAGHDTLVGGPGNDRLKGGPGIDTMDGGAGVDILDTRDRTRGSDRTSGGLGKDRCLADAGSKSCP